MLNISVSKIVYSVMLVFYIFLFPNLHAHDDDDFSGNLIIEGDYIWFPQDYHTNSLVITNSNGTIAVDQCERWHLSHDKPTFQNSEEIEVADDEPFIIRVDKNLIENYLTAVASRDQIKEALYKILEITSESGNNQIDVGIDDFIKIKIILESIDINPDLNPDNCPNRECKLALDENIEEDCKSKLRKLPTHYFSNEQVFMLTESIYPKTIVINPGDNELKIETIINSGSVKVAPVLIDDGIIPLAAKIQTIFEYKDDTHTGTGSERVRLGEIKIKRKPKKKKIIVNWGPR